MSVPPRCEFTCARHLMINQASRYCTLCQYCTKRKKGRNNFFASPDRRDLAVSLPSLLLRPVEGPSLAHNAISAVAGGPINSGKSVHRTRINQWGEKKTGGAHAAATLASHHTLPAFSSDSRVVLPFSARLPITESKQIGAAAAAATTAG